MPAEVTREQDLLGGHGYDLKTKTLASKKTDSPDGMWAKSFPRLNEIIHGKRPVTPDTALRLERVLGMPADFWLGLQLDWNLWHAMRGQTAADIAGLEPLQVGP